MNLFEKRFVINTGKGGVGKSTISAAMALAAARRNLRVLVIELNTRERISRLFGKPPVGSEITEIHDNLWAVNITPANAMKEYVLLKLRIEFIYRVVFENRFVQQFLRAIPGLKELVLIGKAWYHEQERDKAGNPKYDIIIVDAPATGHGIFFLRIPRVINDALSTGPMVEETRKILDLLQDPKRTVLNLITLMEEMPVNETIELKRRVDSTLDMPMGYLIANGIYPTLFTPKEASQIEELRNARGRRGDIIGRLLKAALFRQERCNLQASYRDRLRRKLQMPVIEVPYYFASEIDFEVIRRIASHIEERVEREERRR